MLDFNDTAIAFRSKSNAELAVSYWLFRLMDFPWLVWVGTRLMNIALKLRLPVAWLIKITLFRQFCGGETIEECEPTIERLGRSGIGTILDYSVEGNGSELAFETATAEILRTIDLAQGNKNIPFCVFKVTGIGRFGLLEKVHAKIPLSGEEDSEWRRVQGRFGSICDHAARKKVRLLVDAEETWIQDPIDHLTEAAMLRHNREVACIYNTLQMYRVDRLEYLKSAWARAEKGGYWLAVKPVRGAYMEKERARAHTLGVQSPIHPTKAATDEAYDAALSFCVDHLERMAICAGTHNEASTHLLADLMKQKTILPSDPRCFFAQLLGMSDPISFNLSHAGYGVAKYVPYGPVRDVMPYLFRRAEENKSIDGQRGRELSLLIQERRRRRRATKSATLPA